MGGQKRVLTRTLIEELNEEGRKLQIKILREPEKTQKMLQLKQQLKFIKELKEDLKIMIHLWS